MFYFCSYQDIHIFLTLRKAIQCVSEPHRGPSHPRKISALRDSLALKHGSLHDISQICLLSLVPENIHDGILEYVVLDLVTYCSL